MGNPTILDFEASGFGKDSYPIEVGFIKGDGSSWCSLIAPEPGWNHWDERAARVHNISRELLLRHGRTAQAVADHLNTVLQGEVVYTDGWLQDYVWMARLFDAAGRIPRFRLEDLRILLTPCQQAIWHATKDTVLAELNFARHRASNDAKILQLTWRRTGDSCGLAAG